MTTRSKAIHIAFLLTTLFLSRPVMAQTSVFKYQGSLTDGGNPANGSFQMRFRLFDAVSGGNQIGSTLNDVPVTAATGIFSASLDFGAPALSGANRWLEISVRRNASESYVMLSPREQIASSPYAVRTLSAAMADDSQKLGGVNANEYVTTTGAGTSFIRNQSTLQPASNFNISGDGIVGGNVGIGTAPGGGYRLNVNGYTRSIDGISTGFVAETTGDVNAWARTFLRTMNSNGTIHQGWFMGTSRDFNGNQFYLSDETGGQSRMTIQPFGGAISFPLGNVGIGTTNPTAKLHVVAGNLPGISVTSQGNALVGVTPTPGFAAIYGENTSGSTGFGIYGKGTTGYAIYAEGNAGQTRAANGLPKAMVFLDGNGIIRCYNGVTGSSSGNCGFGFFKSSVGTYRIDFGFQVNDRFFYLTGADFDRFASWALTCTICNANQLLVVLENNAGVDVDGRVMAIVF